MVGWTIDKGFLVARSIVMTTGLAGGLIRPYKGLVPAALLALESDVICTICTATIKMVNTLMFAC